MRDKEQFHALFYLTICSNSLKFFSPYFSVNVRVNFANNKESLVVSSKNQPSHGPT